MRPSSKNCPTRKSVERQQAPRDGLLQQLATPVDDNLARSVLDAWRLQTAQRQDDRGELLAQISLNPELADGALDGLLQDLTARTSRN
jgi:hypothetical protein